MEIIIENYKITQDTHNYILSELREVINNKTHEARQDWVEIGYYGKNIKKCLHGILKNKIFKSNAKSLNDVLDAIASCEETINNLNI